MLQCIFSPLNILRTRDHVLDVGTCFVSIFFFKKRRGHCISHSNTLTWRLPYWTLRLILRTIHTEPLLMKPIHDTFFHKNYFNFCIFFLLLNVGSFCSFSLAFLGHLFNVEKLLYLFVFLHLKTPNLGVSF